MRKQCKCVQAGMVHESHAKQMAMQRMQQLEGQAQDLVQHWQVGNQLLETDTQLAKN